MNTKTLALLSFATLVLAGCVNKPQVMEKKVETTPVAVVSTSPTASDSMTKDDKMIAEEVVEVSDFKDGTYTADGAYTSPAGPEKVSVTITLKDGLVTNVKVTPMATNPASIKWQTAFSGGVSTEVVGKSLDEISLTKVSGSSLTPKGFSDALMQIKKKAS